MAYLRGCLDDPATAGCGRCDRCAGAWYPVEVSEPALAAARAHLGRTGVEIAPRRMWPTGLPAIGVPLSGRIPAGEQSEPGRAVGRLSDLGWGERLRRAIRADQPVPDDVFAGVVEALAAWSRGPDSWSARPAGVVTIASGARPALVASLGARIAQVGRLPLIGSVEVIGASAASGVNSAQRVRALHERLAVPRLPSLDGPVLLVDDYVDSGWTMALAARALRRAGAGSVLPFALAVVA
jgi:ATP-dependent DNA helicase RecQ